jgi:hypothetical protein
MQRLGVVTLLVGLLICVGCSGGGFVARAGVAWLDSYSPDNWIRITIYSRNRDPLQLNFKDLANSFYESYDAVLIGMNGINKVIVRCQSGKKLSGLSGRIILKENSQMLGLIPGGFTELSYDDFTLATFAFRGCQDYADVSVNEYDISPQQMLVGRRQIGHVQLVIDTYPENTGKAVTEVQSD